MSRNYLTKAGVLLLDLSLLSFGACTSGFRTSKETPNSNNTSVKRNDNSAVKITKEQTEKILNRRLKDNRSSEKAVKLDKDKVKVLNVLVEKLAQKYGNLNYVDGTMKDGATLRITDNGSNKSINLTSKATDASIESLKLATNFADAAFETVIISKADDGYQLQSIVTINNPELGGEKNFLVDEKVAELNADRVISILKTIS